MGYARSALALLRLVLVATLPWCLTPVAAEATPDFSRSRISITPAKPAEGDVVLFTVDVINSGDEDAPFTEVKFELPLEAMFVGVDGLDKLEVNPLEKVLAATIALPAGAARQFRVRMVIPRDAGGRMLTPDLMVRYLYRAVEFYGHESYDVETRVSTAGIALGGVRFTPAGIAVLAFVIGFPVLWLALFLMMPSGRVRDESGFVPRSAGRSRTPATAAFAILLPFGFWTMFGAMAVRDWQSGHTWPETSCTITDSRLREEPGAASNSRPSDLARRTRTVNSRTYEPLLALRYTVDGNEVVSTGFQTGSHLRVGGRAQADSNLAGWPIDARVPCWYNPADPHDVVVKNGFGGAYFFALFPLPIAVFGFYRARALIRRR